MSGEKAKCEECGKSQLKSMMKTMGEVLLCEDCYEQNLGGGSAPTDPGSE